MQSQEIVLVASGDQRISANQTCWPAQQKVEEAITAAIASFGFLVRRGHPVDPVQGHGFLKSQRHGIEVFRQIPPDTPSNLYIRAPRRVNCVVGRALTLHRMFTPKN
jgi:hypothetical protein